jgi:hypothetical protein
MAPILKMIVISSLPFKTTAYFEMHSHPELRQMVVEVLVEHIVPLRFVQHPERVRFPAIEMRLAQLLRLSDVCNEPLFFPFKLLGIRHDKLRGRPAVARVRHFVGHAFFHKSLQYKTHDPTGLGVLVLEGHLVGHVAVGEHLRHVHLAPLCHGTWRELVDAGDDFVGGFLCKDIWQCHVFDYFNVKTSKRTAHQFSDNVK